MVYLDTSALLELIVQQRDIDPLIAAIAESERVVSVSITIVEARCSIERMRRGGRISGPTARRAVTELSRSWATIARVVVDDALIARAIDVGTRRGLRGYDAVQLAAALSLRAAPTLEFATFDIELADAANAEGLRALR